MSRQKDIEESVESLMKVLIHTGKTVQVAPGEEAIAATRILSDLRTVVEQIYSKGLQQGFIDGTVEARKNYERQQAKNN